MKGAQSFSEIFFFVTLKLTEHLYSQASSGKGHKDFICCVLSSLYVSPGCDALSASAAVGKKCNPKITL
jgi:hypothetical protein